MLQPGATGQSAHEHKNSGSPQLAILPLLVFKSSNTHHIVMYNIQAVLHVNEVAKMPRQ
jgi:hypothetical protein